MISQDFVKFTLQITVMLGIALFIVQIMRRLKQPAVLGELLGGIILGTTILGVIFPRSYNWLFQSSENIVIAKDAFIKIGMLFFMFTVGREVNLSDLHDTKKALVIGLVGTLLPITAGIGLVYLIPHNFWGPLVQEHFFIFSLFIGINLANSANPVIARILMDVGYLRDKLGTIIMAATVVDDIVNWLLFAIILNVITPRNSMIDIDLNAQLILTIAFFIVTIIIGKMFAKKALNYLHNHITWPSGFISFIILIILMASSLTEFIGIHAFLGAFLVGVVITYSGVKAHKAYEVIENFSMNFFAPIYFVSIGMTTNFLTNFDFILVMILLVAACIAKFGSVLLGAHLAGMKINRQVMAIASGLNARGATGIILAGVGLDNGLIDERIFVAIFIMAFVTSFMSCTLINFFLVKNS